MKITVKDGQVQLESFRDLLPVEQVEFYECLELEDGSVELKFYDKNYIVIKPFKKKK